MKRHNILLTILVTLVLIFVVTNYFKKNSSTNFKPEIMAIDTSLIQKIAIHAPAKINENPIVISKMVNQWSVRQGEIENEAKKSMMSRVMKELNQITSEQLVTKTKNKWVKYDLTDSLARRVEISEEGTGKINKLYFGKTTYEQLAHQQYGNRSLKKSSYMRINDDPKVYAIKSDLSSFFEQNFDEWRNPDFIKTDIDEITQIQFDYPNEKFAITKKDITWAIEDVSIDSAKVAQYVSRWEYQTNSKFADEFKPVNQADYRITIKAEKDFFVEAYNDSVTHKFYMRSSQRPEIFIESDTMGLFKKLCVNKTYFEKGSSGF